MTPQVGSSFLIYGKTGSGKSYSALSLSEVGRTLIINCEERNLSVISQQIKHPPGNLKIIDYTDHDQILKILDTIYKKSENKPLYDFVCLDGATFLQGRIKIRLEDDMRSKQEKKRRDELPLTDSFNIGEAGWGAMGSLMKRMAFALNHLNRRGIITVMTANVMENPRLFELDYAPAFQGKDFTLVLPAFFDHIGYLTLRFKDDEQVYPSAISFVSNTDTFMAKSCLPNLRKRFKCDMKKIVGRLTE
jgi:hypothetical protein